jgi:hypothetical protein
MLWRSEQFLPRPEIELRFVDRPVRSVGTILSELSQNSLGQPEIMQLFTLSGNASNLCSKCPSFESRSVKVISNIVLFWDMTPCSSVDRHQCLEGHAAFILNIEECSSETLVPIYQKNYLTNQLHGAETFFRSYQSLSYSKMSQYFMEPDFITVFKRALYWSLSWARII